MRFRPMILAALVLVGCVDFTTSNGTTLFPENAPKPPGATNPGTVWVMVADQTGACIANASLAVVRGQDSGFVAVLDANCNAYSPDGGFLFTNLVPGVPMTVRAFAPGFLSVQMTLVPTVVINQPTVFWLVPDE